MHIEFIFVFIILSINLNDKESLYMNVQIKFLGVQVFMRIT